VVVGIVSTEGTAEGYGPAFYLKRQLWIERVSVLFLGR